MDRVVSPMLTFRYPSSTSLYLFYGIGIFVAVVIWCVSDARPESMASIPLFVWLSLLFSLGFVLYGVHIRTLEITVENGVLTVRSIFIDRRVAFGDIQSVRDLDSQTWRTLDVQTKTGRRILYLSDTGFPEYAALVDVLREGTAESVMCGNVT
jgi:hypothetical protein